jgi:hypothetical protein
LYSHVQLLYWTNRAFFLEKRYGTLTAELDRLRDTLVENDTGHVALESTGIYRIPVWRTLQSDFSSKLANPYFIKQLPGRKSDVKDAQWIAQCLQKELIRGSYVPDDVLQQMRQYARQHRRLSKNRVRIEQQMDNRLQRCNSALAIIYPIRGVTCLRARSSGRSQVGNGIRLRSAVWFTDAPETAMGQSV